MLTLDDDKDCEEIWRRLNVDIKYPLIGNNFAFRKFYSSLFGMSPYFVCDSMTDPSYVVPLCKGPGGIDWFGTSELDAPTFHCTNQAYKYLLDILVAEGLENLQISNVDSSQLQVLQNLGIALSFEHTGTKAIFTRGKSFAGKDHWSKRNIFRAQSAYAELDASWTITDNPTKENINIVFDKSVEMFLSRGLHSKFEQDNKREKYLALMSSPVEDIRPVLATCYVNELPAVYALILVYGKTATVALITPNSAHPEHKLVTQYGFRFGVSALPAILEKEYDCIIVDYQGGNHSWKEEVSVECQHPQYRVKLGI